MFRICFSYVTVYYWIKTQHIHNSDLLNNDDHLDTYHELQRNLRSFENREIGYFNNNSSLKVSFIILFCFNVHYNIFGIKPFKYFKMIKYVSCGRTAKFGFTRDTYIYIYINKLLFSLVSLELENGRTDWLILVMNYFWKSR